MSSLFLLLFLLLLNESDTHSSENPTFMSANQRLYEKLFGTYYPSLSPYNTGSITNSTESPVDVEIALGYAHLTQVAEMEMSHNHVVGLSMKWRDPRLAWNPAEYGSISYLYVNANQLWIPEVLACESSKFGHITDDRVRKIRLHHSGQVEYYFTSYATFICSFNTHAFPFDAHWCYYCFSIPQYENSELALRGYDLPEQAVMSMNEWGMHTAGFHYESNLTEEGKIVEDRSVIYFNIFLERRSTFWVLLIIVPSYLIGLMILLGLFFSSEEPTVNTSVRFPNNRVIRMWKISELLQFHVNLGLISFTSMTFIIGILADSLPKSASLSNLGWYILIELLLTTLAVLSVFCQTAINRWARQGVKWWTGGAFRPYSTESGSSKVEERKRAAPTFHHLLHYAVEKIIVVGTAHFFIFFLLHTANVSWLMLYPLFDAPQRTQSLHMSGSGRI